MQEAPFRTVHTYVNDSNEDMSTCTELPNEEGNEDQDDGIHPKIEQIETPTITKGESKVNNVVNTIQVPMGCQDQSYKQIQKIEEFEGGAKAKLLDDQNAYWTRFLDMLSELRQIWVLHMG